MGQTRNVIAIIENIAKIENVVNIENMRPSLPTWRRPGWTLALPRTPVK